MAQAQGRDVEQRDALLVASSGQRRRRQMMHPLIRGTAPWPQYADRIDHRIDVVDKRPPTRRCDVGLMSNAAPFERFDDGRQIFDRSRRLSRTDNNVDAALEQSSHGVTSNKARATQNKYFSRRTRD
jgi:hypothetical protein